MKANQTNVGYDPSLKALADEIREQAIADCYMTAKERNARPRTPSEQAALDNVARAVARASARRAETTATGPATGKTPVIKASPAAMTVKKSKSVQPIDSRTVEQRETDEAALAIVAKAAKSAAKSAAANARANVCADKVKAAKATADTDKVKAAKEKAEKAARAADNAQAKADKDSAAATAAQAVASEKYDTRESGASETRKAVHAAGREFLTATLGVVVKKDLPAAALLGAFNLNATSIRLLPLGKCAHVIALAIGAVPVGQSVVSADECKAAYPANWSRIRDVYNTSANAFKVFMSKAGDAHATSFALKAKVGKKGKVSGSLAMQAKVLEGSVTPSAVRFNTALVNHATKVAVTRWHAIGACQHLDMRDLLRVLRAKGKRDKETGRFALPVKEAPGWASGEQAQAIVSALADTERAMEGILSLVKGMATIAHAATAKK